MKSEGTCVCGGKVTFKTSGQQVMVTPPHSMREAEQVVYAHPLLKKEDVKNVSTKKTEKKEKPTEQFSKNAFVNSVRVNGHISISLRLYDKEPLVFTNTLTRGADPTTAVKWDVTHDGKNIVTALPERPDRSIFKKEGEYKVFAYVKKRGSKKGGGYVTVTVSEPKFISLDWKDTNGKTVRYIGKRYIVYAHVKLKGVRGIPIEARFCYRSMNGIEKLTEFAPLQIEQDGTAKVELSLTDSQAEEIKDMQTEKTFIYMELFSKQWIENLSLSEKTPIEYTDKEDITGIALYRNKDCKEVITDFIESGQTIYARVTTRGLDDSYITLLVCRHDMEKEEGANLYGGVYLVSGDTNSHGIAILEIQTDTTWLLGKQSETFDIFVLEGVSKEHIIIMKNGRNYIERNTTKLFQMSKDKGILLLSMPKQEGKRGQSKTMVQEVKEEKNNCICKKYDLIWGRKVDCAFRKKVVQIAKNIGLPQEKYEGANWLMAVMALETQKIFNPSKQNPFGYTGLIQFGNAAASRLGTKTSALKIMSAVNQLNYVEKYFSLKEFNGKLNTLTDLYLAVLYPTACGHGKEKNYIVLKDSAYINNPVFFKEKDEKDEKGKPKAKKDGKTYIWEIEEVIHQSYKEGVKWKEMQFNNCVCKSIDNDDTLCPICKKQHIDLRSKVAFQTQFSSIFGDKNKQNAACWRACKKMLSNAGLSNEAGGKTGLFQIAKEIQNANSNNQNIYLKIDLNVAKNAIMYLDKQLEIGNPVLAGVDHHYKYKYDPKKKTVLNEGTTDHFILIIGRLCKSGIIQYLFYDPGTSSDIKGGSDENILTLNQVDYSLRGTTKYNATKKYVVTQIRRN